ncbi:MAG: hypothetical protein IJS46_04815 [Kiritimatiellae bacterium]|nr:hypothetical protein [Kiritimatiellia bacterium]
MTPSALSLHACFSDHMVLQRGKPVRVSGFAPPDATVVGLFRGDVRSVAVPESGEWELTFPAGPEGGPFTLEVRTNFGNAAIELKDVMVGELWLCSGQSNMEYPVLNPNNEFFGLPEGADVARDGDGGIRVFQTPRALAPDDPCSEPPGRPSWKRGDDPAAVGEFSAVAWFFGRALRRRLGPGVPVGLVNSSWGGSKIEPWIPRAAFEKAGRTEELARSDIAKRWRAPETDGEKSDSQACYLAAMAPVFDWLRDKFFATDPETSAAALSSWAKPDIPPDEKDRWSRGRRGHAGMLDSPAVGWFRREFTLRVPEGGSDCSVFLATVNDCDETFLDGVKIGETTPATPEYWSRPRIYSAKIRPTPGDRHVLAVRVQNHFGGGAFCGKTWISAGGCDPVKVDLEGGEWLERLEFKVDRAKAGIRPPVNSGNETPRMSAQVPSTLYNAMVAPFLPLSPRGAIWYQGCSNRDQPEEYAALQDLLVEAWREAFRVPDMVFIGTQLSAWRRHAPSERMPDDWWKALSPLESCSGPEGECAAGFGQSAIREAQMRLLDAPLCGLACSIDVGDHSDIHPRRKKPVGERLAHEAARVAYGDASATPGPRAVSARREGAAVRVAVRDGDGGLVIGADGAPAQSAPALDASEHLFSLEDASGAWEWASGKVESDGSILVSSPNIANPVHVFYAFGDSPPEEHLLHRASDGLPLFPFRLEATC